MPVISTATVNEPRTVYPVIMEHVPTGCIVMFSNKFDGWLVADPDGKASHAGVGDRWQNHKPDNYRTYFGVVTLQNEVCHADNGL